MNAICLLYDEQPVRHGSSNKVKPRRIKVRDNAIAMTVGQLRLGFAYNNEYISLTRAFIAWFRVE